MNEPIKHHFVPQCYLRKFSLDKTKVNFYDKQLHVTDQEDIEVICQIENFYRLSRFDPMFLETDFFSRNNEDKLGKILSRFEKLDYNLNEIHYDKNHRENLSKQIVIQFMRTPKYRDTKATNELNLYYGQIANILKDRFNFEVEEIEFQPENKAEFHKTILIDDLEECIKEIQENMLDAEWELLYTQSGEFYTSDSPVVIKARRDMPVTYCEAIKFFSEIYYPLNAKLLLHIEAKQPTSTKRIKMRICNNEELWNINTSIIDNAVKYVIYLNKFNTDI